MVYNPGQLCHVAPFVHTPPRWFILAGPADGNESQTACCLWPDVRVIALEPVERLRDWQRAHGFPPDGLLLPNALWNRCGPLRFVEATGHPRHSSAVRAVEGTAGEVEAITLDRLAELHGPFEGAFLWMDIEGSEAYALEGAAEVLRRGMLDYVNIEVAHEGPGDWTCHRLLSEAGFWPIHVWNRQPTHHDVLYRRVR
jgi:FkbM family methyltransferase